MDYLHDNKSIRMFLLDNIQLICLQLNKHTYAEEKI